MRGGADNNEDSYGIMPRYDDSTSHAMILPSDYCYLTLINVCITALYTPIDVPNKY